MDFCVVNYFPVSTLTNQSRGPTPINPIISKGWFYLLEVESWCFSIVPYFRMDCPGAGAEDDQDDLLRVVRGLLDKENRQQKDDQIRREWRMLAEAVDRWLFWSFLLITTISTMLFLVILPFCHRGKFFWKKWSRVSLSPIVASRWVKMKISVAINCHSAQLYSGRCNCKREVPNFVYELKKRNFRSRERC